MERNETRENIIGLSRLLLLIDLVLCLYFIFNFSELSDLFKEIGSGFFCASIFTFIGFIIKDKPEWITKFFMSRDGDFKSFFGLFNFILYLLMQIFLLIFVLVFTFLAFYIIDYEFINEGLNYFGINHDFEKPKFLVKLSFIITTAILAYCYSNCKDK